MNQDLRGTNQDLWSKSYPQWVRAKLPPPEHSSLGALAKDCAKEFREQVAFTTVLPNGINGSLTFTQVDVESDRLACFFRNVWKLQPGDRVAVQMPNCLCYPVAVLGILKAGLILVNINPLYTAREMEFQLKDSGARALILIDIFGEKLSQLSTLPEFVLLTRISEYFPAVVGPVVRLIQKYWNQQTPEVKQPHFTWKESLAKVSDSELSEVSQWLASVQQTSTAVIQYTGGTTGVAKGAELTHANLLWNVAQAQEIIGPKIRRGQEVVLTALPLYHIFAFTVNFFLFYKMGGKNLLIPNPRPLANLKRAFENYPVTWLSGVNTLFNGLLQEFWFHEYPPKHLVGAVAGGMALHPSVAERWRNLTNTPIVEGYGLTESSPVISFNPLGGKVKDGSIGIPLSNTEVRLVGKNSESVKLGEPGELLVRGPQVMKGYWQKPKETLEVLNDGWLATGDIAIQDSEGYLRLVDRKKDMVLVSGFNVFPNEVEAVIAEFTGVIEVAVVGVPDASSGEAVKAFVVLSAEIRVRGVGEKELRAHCQTRLTGYKLPKHWEFREELPKTPVGKILRKDLRGQ